MAEKLWLPDVEQVVTHGSLVLTVDTVKRYGNGSFLVAGVVLADGSRVEIRGDRRVHEAMIRHRTMRPGIAP